MVDILVRNIDEETARRLKDNAAANGASVNETARQAIAEYVKLDKAELMAKADALRKMIGKVSGIRPRSSANGVTIKNATGDARGRCKRRGLMGWPNGFCPRLIPIVPRPCCWAANRSSRRIWCMPKLATQSGPRRTVAGDCRRCARDGARSAHCAGADGRTRRTRHQHRHQAEAPDLRLFLYRADRARRRRAHYHRQTIARDRQVVERDRAQSAVRFYPVTSMGICKIAANKDFTPASYHASVSASPPSCPSTSPAPAQSAALSRAA